jgi:apolipoprotein N-acyltransferase
MSEPLPGEATERFFNSIQVVRDDGSITATYDKVHLVPFGEYVPRAFDALIRAVGLRAFVSIPGGFDAGDRRRLLPVPGLPAAAATVCYEAIFTGAVRPEEGEARLLLNVTNDAWFGRTPGPHQHFAQARLRAVEEGLPLVRAANTGISAVVDPYGRVVRSLPLGAEGTLDSSLPTALSPSVYRGLGSAAPFAMVLACLTLALTARRRGPDPTSA